MKNITKNLWKSKLLCFHCDIKTNKNVVLRSVHSFGWLLWLWFYLWMFFNIIIWFNWFIRFIIKLNFVIFGNLKICVNYNYFKYSFINKFKCIFSNFELSYIVKYYLSTSNLFIFMELCIFFHFKMYNN
jgi:hypothetical protein